MKPFAEYWKYLAVVNDMKYRNIVALVTVTLLTACTATPEQYKRMPELPGQSVTSLESSAARTGNAKALAVADAAIGLPQVFVDQQAGVSVELVVQSEYFSANGRTCRRYAEFVEGQSTLGVICLDSTHGWIDVPLSSFVR